MHVAPETFPRVWTLLGKGAGGNQQMSDRERGVKPGIARTSG